ncbi:Arm DNA-binding domain-containing protein [Acinetobacter rudis]|uniref:Arm DNA-binding domain-containing protein n=1 Tax=Acinetobacter rudis TaxID=632955 RepID=UPI00333E1ED7
MTGAKLWHFRYRFLGKASMLSLSEYPMISLAQARKMVEEQKLLLSQNIDPAKYKVEEKEKIKLAAETTFKEVALEWYES